MIRTAIYGVAILEAWAAPLFMAVCPRGSGEEPSLSTLFCFAVLPFAALLVAVAAFRLATGRNAARSGWVRHPSRRVRQ